MPTVCESQTLSNSVLALIRKGRHLESKDSEKSPEVLMIGEMLQSSIVERITSPVREHAVHHAVEAIQLSSMVKRHLSLIVQHARSQ